MKRKFTFLTAALALLAFLAIPVGMWGQSSTSSLVFTAACGGSGTADDGAIWIVTSDGTESSFDNNKGIHYGTGSAAVQYIQLSTSDISGNITKIVVNASTASGVTATVGVTVGGSAFGGDPQSLSATATEYTFNGSASGDIVVLITKPSQATKALYCKSIVVTYETGGGSTDPTITATPTTLAVPNQVVNAYDGTQTATLDVEGSNLTDNVTIALNGGTSSKFEMKTDGQTWASSLTLEQSGGSFSSKVTIRLKDNLEVGEYNDVITLSSEGATDVTVNVNASVTTPPTYTVTYDSNGGSGTMTDPDSPYHAGDVVALLASTFTAPEGMIWDSWQVKDADNNDVEVNNGTFTMPASNVTVTAQWIPDPDAPEYEWVLTDLAELTANDVFVIVGDNGDTYAMTNDNGTGSAPAASDVTVDNGKLSDAPADNLKWNISGNATDGYTFYPNGSTENWLYCTNTNNGVRVGKNNSKTFTINSGYLYHDGTSRHVGIYNAQDWRCYSRDLPKHGHQSRHRRLDMQRHG